MKISIRWILFLSMLGGFAYSQGETCSAKFSGANVCDSLAAGQDSDFMLFLITFDGPPTGVSKDSANILMRKWADTLFLKYDIRDPADTGKELGSPSNGQLKWYYEVNVTKKMALGIVAEEFVKRMLYKSSASTCNVKFSDHNICDSLMVKSDSDYMVFSIAIISRPTGGAKPTAEDMAKLRKWTDTLFAEYDLRAVTYNLRPDTAQKLPAPPDSALDWDYLASMTKAEALSLVERSFILRLSYSTERVTLTRKSSPKKLPPVSLTSYDLLGRRMVDIPGSRARGFFPGVRVMHKGRARGD